MNEYNSEKFVEEKMQNKSMDFQQTKNKAIQALKFSITNIKTYFSSFKDLPSLKMALVVILGIITLIVLGLLIGYLAAIFNLIKI